MYEWMDGYKQNCLKIFMYVHTDTYTYMHTESNSWQNVFSIKNLVIIGMKEQIWLPNKCICDCCQTLNRY